MEMLALHGLLVRAREWTAALLPWVRPAAVLGAPTAQHLPFGQDDSAPGEPIAIAGLQRSGTNFLESILATLYGAERLMNPFWKHAFPEEVAAGQLDETAVVLLARHPVLWLNSCLEHYPADLIEKRFSFFEGVSREAACAKLYNKFYGEWLEVVERFGGAFARYEDLLRGDYRALKQMGGRIDPTGGLAQAFQASPDRVPQSLRFSGEDRRRSLRMECTMPEDTAKAFWDALDPALLARTGYQFDEVRFTDKLGVRTIAYRLLHRPQDVSDAELDGLVKVARSRFGNDAAVLHAIGKRMAGRGRAAEALDWHAAALVACDREDAEFGNKSEGAFRRLDIAEEVLASFRRGELASEADGARGPAFWERALQSAATSAEANLRERMEIDAASGNPAIVCATNLFQLSDLLRRAGRIGEAVDAARQAAELWPENAGFHNQLASLLILLNDVEAAEAALRRAIALEPASAPHHYLLADLLELQGRADEALGEYAQAVTSGGVVPWFHHRRGQLLAGLGRLDEAAESLVKAIQTEPDNGLHHFVLNEIRQSQGRFDEAEASLRAAVACSPGDARLHFALSAVLEQQDKLDDALAHLEAATASPGAEPWFFHRKGALLVRLGRPEAAEASLDEAIRREPDNMLHHYLQCEARCQQGRLEAAEASLREALRCVPGNGRLLFMLSELLLQMGRGEEALARLEAAAASAEATPWMVHRYGVELSRAGRLDEAEARLREAIRLEPEAVAHHCALYEILAAQGRLEEARACLREAQRLAPDDAAVGAALDGLGG